MKVTRTLFFGRELLTARLIERLRESDFLAVVVGASGSGKSSIVRAGLIPALKNGEPLADGACRRPAAQRGDLKSSRRPRIRSKRSRLR